MRNVQVIWVLLAGCLLSLAGCLLPWPDTNFNSTVPPDLADSRPASIQESAGQLPPDDSFSRSTETNQVEPASVTVQPSQGDPFANPNNPTNSQDLNQNREWAREFPSAALAWVQSAPESKQRDAIAEIAFSKLADTNPAGAVALAGKIAANGAGPLQENILENLAQRWADRDEQAASAWASALPPGPVRDGALDRIAFVQAKTDPADAAQLVANEISPGALQNDAAMSVLYQWAKQDAAAATVWAQSFPEGDLRNRAIQEIKNVSAISSNSSP